MAPRRPAPLLGAHMSIAGGLHRAVARAEAVDATALQVFTRNNLQWAAPPLADNVVEKFRTAWAESAVGHVVAHASYLLDLATADPGVSARSLDGLITEFRRAARLGIPWVILHPGHHLGQGEAEGLRRAAAQARRALEETASLDVGLLLENTAGQGTALGHRFDHLAQLLGAIGVPDRLGICLDTCHAHAAGYDLRTPRAYRDTMAELDAVVGLGRLHAIHVNDAKGELGSRLDRHAHIGHGQLGLGAFRSLMRDRRLDHVPKLLETPKEDAERKDWDAVNLAALRKLHGAS